MLRAEDARLGRIDSSNRGRIGLLGERERAIVLGVDDEDVSCRVLRAVTANVNALGVFNRLEFTRKVGFDEANFYTELRAKGLEECGGPFRGICDTEIARYLGDRLATEPQKRHAIAWLTLNSHLPVTEDHNSSALLGCGTANPRIPDEPSCELMALVLRAELAVAKMAERPDINDTEFLIVGDHAPPFLRASRRALYSQIEVPFVHLLPRSKSHP